MFLPGECLVVVAEQADDGRKFNRRQVLNAAFKHLRETHASSLDVRETLYRFHDCDMLPDASLAAHYLRGPPVPARSGREDAVVVVIVRSRFRPRVCADGGAVRRGRVLRGRDDLRSAGLRGDERVPERVLGLGGGQRAVPPLRARGPGARRRAARPFATSRAFMPTIARSYAPPVERAAEERREGEETARENARSWRMDGLTDVTFESSVPARTAVPTATRIEENAEKTKTKNENAGAPIRVRLRAAIADEVACAECGERKGASGFASHQHKRAMFYAARARKTGSVDRVSGRERRQDAARDGARIVWRERNRVARLCPWDERGGTQA